MSMLLAVLTAVFLIVVLAEIFWRTKTFGPEQSRKLVHVGVGTFASTWGFILEDKQIVFIAGAMFLVVLASRVFGVFGSIHNVTRKTWGELFFPLGIATAALLANSPWIYMAAVLHVSIADGLAALIGRKYIKKHGYKLFKQQKTVVGTLVFFSASLIITSLTVLLSPNLQLTFLAVLTVSLVATLAENLGQLGADDLLVPLAVVVLLNSL